MNPYFRSEYRNWQAQIVKELGATKSFEDFIELPFLNGSIKRYYTKDEHQKIAPFAQKLSASAAFARNTHFNNYLWLSPKTEALKHLSDGSYNGLFFESEKLFNGLDQKIELGYVKSILAQGSLEKEHKKKFIPQGDLPQTLIQAASETYNNESFVEQGIFDAYHYACRGADIDSELANLLYHASLFPNHNRHAIVSFGADDWFHLNAKLRALPYLWYSMLSDNNQEIKQFNFSLVAIKSCFVDQDNDNHLLRQCMATFAALSHGADGIVHCPYTSGYLGEHASGRIASILEYESHLNQSTDLYQNNYLLDFASQILVDAVWEKYQALKQAGTETEREQLLHSWLAKDKETWLNDNRKFIGLSHYLSEENTALKPAFSPEGFKTFT